MEGKKKTLKQRKFRENATGDKNTSTPILEKRKSGKWKTIEGKRKKEKKRLTRADKMDNK